MSSRRTGSASLDQVSSALGHCQMLRLASVVLLAACHHGASKPVVKPDPRVDEQCLADARAGRLIEVQPAEAAGFRVTRTESGVRMVRVGRRLARKEGEALWHTFEKQFYGRGGLGMGSSALYSVDKCVGVDDASCLTLDAYICQRDLATIGAWVAEAAARIGAPDGELGIVINFIERHGPSCREGAACTPTPHYSTPRAVYDPAAPRKRVEIGRGRCTTDGDCVGKERNSCTAWWLLGVETLEYVEHGRATFCGCVEQTCSWFTQ